MHANQTCRSGLLLFALILTCGSSISCTDVLLARYRDDQLVAGYRYALGEQYLEVDGMRLCYQECGQGPNLLILPGLATSVEYWRNNLPILAENFHVVAVDLPGCGKSDKPDLPYDLDWTCDRIIAFATAKGLRRFSVIGGSLGGHLALLLALDHPDRVDKVVMMGSTGAWEPPELLLDGFLKHFWNDFCVTDFLRGRWPVVHDMMFKRDTDLSRELFRYEMARRAVGTEFWTEGRAISRSLKSIFYHTCRKRLDQLRAPLLVIWGEDDRIHQLKYAMWLREHAPDARLYVVADSRHEVMADQPEIFNRVVASFLEHGTAGVEDNHFKPGMKAWPQRTASPPTAQRPAGDQQVANPSRSQ